MRTTLPRLRQCWINEDETSRILLDALIEQQSACEPYFHVVLSLLAPQLIAPIIAEWYSVFVHALDSDEDEDLRVTAPPFAQAGYRLLMEDALMDLYRIPAWLKLNGLETY